MNSLKLSSAALLVFILISLGLLQLPGAYLTNVPVTVKQPDGQELKLFASGDEYYNWLHDQKGFTIMQDPGNGYYVYALKVNGVLVPTAILPGEGVDPGALGLQEKILDDPDKRPATADLFFNPDEIINAPHSGTLNNLVIFIRFSDESEFTDNISSYNSLFNTTTAGANSMRNYFYEVSYNALTVPSTFYPTPGATVISYQDTQPRNYFRPYDATTNPGGYANSSERTTREHNLLKRAVDHVNGLGQFPPGASIDGDGDGNVDNVCFIIYGTPGAWSSLLWPHRWSLYSVTATIDGKRVYDYNFQLQSTTRVGVLCHEMFHTLGSPDLYHYTGNGITPVGGWDLMENNANPPQHMLTHMKWKYGQWLAAAPAITASGTYTLNPSTSATNNCYKIASPYSATQYFIVEYRKRTGTFENSIPGEGLIVYRINTAAVGNASGPPDEVYIYRPNGTNSVNGTISQANYSSNSGRTTINDGTNPSSFLADGSLGGLDISNVTAVGATIAFTVGIIPGYAIGGTITAGGSPLAGVVLSGLLGNPATNGSGAYSATVPSGWSGTVTPTLGGYSFTPAQSTYSNVLANQTTNYTALALPSESLCQAVDNCSLTWTSSGNALYYGQGTFYFHDADAAQSGNIDDAQNSHLETQVTGPGTLAFYWKVSSELGWDYLKFYIDNVEQSGRISGEVDWQQKVYSITAGTHALKWSYTKDGSISTGWDCGWIDKVEYTPGGGGTHYNSPASRLILPEVNWASASGGGDWISEVQIVDVTGGSTVQVYYNSGTNRRGPFTLWSNNSGAAGSSRSWSNMLQTIDGLDAGAFTYYGSGGSLEMITQDNSHKIQAAIRSTNGNYSRTFPALADVDTNTAASGRTLIVPNMSMDTAFRPSLVLFNPSAYSVTANVQIFASNGSQVGSTITKTLAGYEMAGVTGLRDNTYSNADIRVTVTGGSGRLLVSGQSANNTSNDPAAHLAVQTGAGYVNSPANRLIFPEVNWAAASGGGDWISEVHITDLSGGAVVQAYYNSGTNRRGPFTLWTNSNGANRSVTFANVLQTIDGLDAGVFTYYGTGGALELVTQGGSYLIQAGLKSYNGNATRTFPALQDVEANTAATGRDLMIPNISNDATYRPSVALFNTTANSVTVEVRLIGGNGSQIGSTVTRTLVGYEMGGVTGLRETTYSNASVRITVTSGSGRVIASGQSANNTSNDPAAHIAAQRQ